jgi:exodeoxyribonuclease VIII
MKTGLHYDLDFKAYRKMTDWISISELNTYRKAPLIYKYQYIDGNKQQQTPQQALGTGLHACYLEPPEWKKLFQVASKIDRRTKDGKIAGELQDKMALKQGITFLNPDQHNLIENAANVLFEHPYLKTVRDKFKCEASMFWMDGEIQCKGRIDAYSPELGTIFDVKTTKDAKNFGKSIIDYGYHRQAAYYLDGLAACTGEVFEEFVWICIEMEAPFLCAVYRADKTMIEIGRAEYKQDLLQFRESQVKNEWPGLSPLVQTISLPQWYLNKAIETKL